MTVATALLIRSIGERASGRDPRGIKRTRFDGSPHNPFMLQAMLVSMTAALARAIPTVIPVRFFW